MNQSHPTARLWYKRSFEDSITRPCIPQPRPGPDTPDHSGTRPERIPFWAAVMIVIFIGVTLFVALSYRLGLPIRGIIGGVP